MIHDITVRLADQAPPYPGDPPFERRFTRTIAGGGACNFSVLSMSLHRGTHVDAPLHFIDGGRAVGDYGLERFLLPALVVEVPPGPAVRPEHFAAADVRPGQAVLFKTDNSRRGWVRSGAFTEDFVHLTLPAGQKLLELRAGLVGIDYATVERRGDPSHPLHKLLLGADILILECVDLGAVPPGRYTLHCPPLSLGPAEASPVRAVLIG